MDTLPTIKFSGRTYVQADDLMKAFPKAFVGCKTIRAIVAKKNIPDSSYAYAREELDGWTENDGKSVKYDKLFIRSRWIRKNIDTAPETQFEDEPPIVDLRNEEKFQDNDGNVIEIEVRGSRESCKCYFKVKDIMDGFGINRLGETITDKKSAYKINVHYQFFYPEESKSSGSGRVKVLYLTYRGLLRVLSNSNKSTADKFSDWASNTLFTIQMGTKDQKLSLIADITGVSFDAVKQVFNKSARKMPCIYLIYLGTVQQLRASLKIDKRHPGANVVYKWGMTEDLDRRLKEHHKAYKKIDGTELKLAVFENIDPQFISTAETKIKHFFESMDSVLPHPDYRELAIVPSKKLHLVKEQYSTVASLYMGHMAELKGELQETKREVEYMRGDFDSKAKLLGKDNELLSKDNELLSKDNELLSKDLAVSKKDNERLIKKIAKLKKKLANKSGKRKH